MQEYSQCNSQQYEVLVQGNESRRVRSNTDLSLLPYVHTKWIKGFCYANVLI